MPDLLTEQKLITNFIKAIFSAISNQRNRALRSAMERDPKFRSIVANLEKNRRELAAWADEKVKNDPEAKKDLEMVRNLVARQISR